MTVLMMPRRPAPPPPDPPAGARRYQRRVAHWLEQSSAGLDALGADEAERALLQGIAERLMQRAR